MRAWRRLPIAVRFLLGHGATGFALASVFMAGLLWGDPGGVGTLLLRHPEAIALLWFFLALSLGAVQIAAAVMLLGTPDKPRDGGGTRIQAEARLSPRARRSRG
jgi:hypothetical protein